MLVGKNSAFSYYFMETNEFLCYFLVEYFFWYGFLPKFEHILNVLKDKFRINQRFLYNYL